MDEFDDEKLKITLAKNVKFYRVKSQESTAEDADISKDTLSKIERGMIIPSTATLLKLCSALKVTPNQLLKGLYEENEKFSKSKSKELLKDFEILIKNYNIQ